jgi:hypothetical protein
MDVYWVPGVNNLKAYGRWAFAEFTDVYTLASDFSDNVDGRFNQMMKEVVDRTDKSETLKNGKTPTAQDCRSL